MHLICPRMVKSIQLWLPDVPDFSKCNNADIDRYVSMPTDSPPVNP